MKKYSWLWSCSVSTISPKLPEACGGSRVTPAFTPRHWLCIKTTHSRLTRQRHATHLLSFVQEKVHFSFPAKQSCQNAVKTLFWRLSLINYVQIRFMGKSYSSAIWVLWFSKMACHVLDVLESMCCRQLVLRLFHPSDRLLMLPGADTLICESHFSHFSNECNHFSMERQGCVLPSLLGCKLWLCSCGTG